jgi:Skp family chaperone for outer membrane proteins
MGLFYLGETMARNITWGNLRTRIRQRTNKEKSQFITDSEIDGMIEEAYAEMYNVLVNTNENYFINSTTLNLVQGTSNYNLP